MRKQVIFKIIFIILILLCITTIVVHAADYSDLNQFDPYGNTSGGFRIVDNAINKTSGVILNIVRIIAFCMAVIILMIMGIQYMIACPEMKAELKKNVPKYITGVIILFAASGILQILTYFIGDAF